jgi:hypothetical protein
LECGGFIIHRVKQRMASEDSLPMIVSGMPEDHPTQ